MPTSDELLAMFCTFTNRAYAASTASRYLKEVERFTAFLASREEHDKDLLAVVAKDVRAFLSDDDDPSKYNWNMGLSALRSFYECLLREELVEKNPTDGIERQEVARRRDVAPLSLQEVFALIEAVQDTWGELKIRNEALVTLLFHSGLRVTEVVSLDVNQVDLENGLLVDVRAKGNNRLSVPLNQAVQGVLCNYLTDREQLTVEPDELALFLTHRGKRLSSRSVQRLLKRAGKAAGLSTERRPVTPHLLRHSHATVLHQLGVGMPVIQDMLGHASIATTQRYVHAGLAERKEASERLAAHWLQYEKMASSEEAEVRREIRISRRTPRGRGSWPTHPRVAQVG